MTWELFYFQNITKKTKKNVSIKRKKHTKTPIVLSCKCHQFNILFGNHRIQFHGDGGGHVDMRLPTSSLLIISLRLAVGDQSIVFFSEILNAF